jgi:ABC-type transport system involved in cytochrome bd biosynthesis fused ATPase/permease subunit
MAAKKKSSKRAQPVTDSQISSLAKEAANAGDNAMVKICGRALSGNKAARTECARVLMAARAMED